jgi:hypothetical protein
MHPRSTTVRRALGLGLLAMLVVLGLSACGGVEKEAEIRHLPEKAKPLQPGEYRSEEFEPSLSFRVGKGWTNVPPESSEFLAIQRGVMGGVYFLGLRKSTSLFARACPTKWWRPTRTPRAGSLGGSIIPICEPPNPSRSR